MSLLDYLRSLFSPETAPSGEDSASVVEQGGMFKFAPACYWKRKGGGPLTLPMTRSRGKMGDNRQVLRWDGFWRECIKSLNPQNRAAADLCARPDFGPSQGLSGKYIKWIGLLWPGENLVRVDTIVNGWGLIMGVESPAEALEHKNDRWLVQQIFLWHRKKGYVPRPNPVFVPVIGGPWWVDMKWLTRLN